MPGVNLERLKVASRSLSEIVVDPGRWPHVLDEISLAVDASGAALLSSSGSAEFPKSPSLDEAFLRYVREGWHERDPRRKGIERQLRGEVAADDDVITADELRGSAFYNEFLPSVGMKWWAGIGVRGGSELFCLSLQRSNQQGYFTSSEKTMLQAFSHRLNEIAALSQAIGRACLWSAIGALDHMAVAAISVDQIGRVLCINTSADELMGEWVRVSHGSFVLRDGRASDEYAELLRRLNATPEGQTLRANPIVVRRGEACPLVLRILPLDGAARSPFIGARAVLTLTAVQRPEAPHWSLVREAMQLTPAEARLASRLATGEAVERAADVLGIAKETARHQLKSIFIKTNTHRQGDLVALLHSLSNNGLP